MVRPSATVYVTVTVATAPIRIRLLFSYSSGYRSFYFLVRAWLVVSQAKPISHGISRIRECNIFLCSVSFRDGYKILCYVMNYFSMSSLTVSVFIRIKTKLKNVS